MAGRDERSPDEPWYAPGLRFRCTMCGNCCSGPAGAVWFSEAEAHTMAAALGIDVPTFRRRHARRLGRRWSLRERTTSHGLDCVFLDRDSSPGRALCSIHPARPAQCRAWPFWPENLASPEEWDRAKRRTPCPGMDRGPLVPLQAIRIQLESLPPDGEAAPGS